MDNKSNVLEFKCPCCNAALIFGADSQNLKCEYCDTAFEIDAINAYNESLDDQCQDSFSWENLNKTEWHPNEVHAIQAFLCPACGGEIITDENTAATFCPFCGNPTIVPSRMSGTLRPDFLIPFKTDKEDASSAFLRLCKGKLLLPKNFLSEQRMEKITGIYVPFWLYSCDTNFKGSYKATRIHRWSDSRYNYTKTDHFLLRRSAESHFSRIPMDASLKMDNSFMESLEPFDYQDLQEFNMAYLSGFFADKYDVPSSQGEERIRQRVEHTIQEELKKTTMGYSTVMPSAHSLQIEHSKVQYILLPVWMLNTRYKEKIYTFAMNGQTGKMTGEFPICVKKATGYFAGICIAVTLLATLFQIIL